MKKYKKVFEQIARKNNTSAAEVEKEISLAILKAVERTDKSEKAELFWDELTKDQKAPTPEKVIDAILKKLP